MGALGSQGGKLISVNEESTGWVIRDATRTSQGALALVELSGALSSAVSTGQVAEALCQHASEALGTGPSLLLLRIDEGEGFALGCTRGYADDVVERIQQVGGDVPTPWGEAARSQHAIVVPADEGALRFAVLRALHEGMPSFPLIAMPLVLGGRSTAVMVLHLSPATVLGDAERAYLLAAAQLGAQALGRARLFEAERRARAETEAARARAVFLADASSLLASSLDHQITLRALVQLAVPRVADLCTIELATGEESSQVAVAHVDGDKIALVEELRRRYPPNAARGAGVAAVLRSGRSELYETLSPQDFPRPGQDAEELRLWRELDPRSVMIVPMHARGRILGALVFVSTSADRRYGHKDLEMAESLADRAALAIDNAVLYREAQDAIRAREDLLAIVSHDLRNVLAVLTLRGAQLGRLLARAAADPPIINHVESIRRASGHMERLIRDLLDMPKAESGTLTVELRREDVASLLEQTLDGFRPVTSQKTLDLRAELPAEPAFALCDRDRLAQVLTNLLANATKFTPDGGQVLVRLSRAEGQLHIEVSDTGMGIARDHLPRIFDRYWQGDRRQRQSVGLGLFIAKAIVEAHGGRVWAESEPGRGTTVGFSLPEEVSQAVR